MIALEPVPLFNSIMSGLVASSAGCAYVDNIGAVIIGVVAGLIYSVSIKVVKRFEIDDPLEVASTHLANGVWGIISVGFLHRDLGLLYVGKADQLIAQFIYLVTLVGWSLLMSYTFFKTIKVFDRLRID